MHFVEWAQFRAPDGFLNAVKERARAEGLNSSEFMRRAILADIEDGRDGDDERADALDDVRLPRDREAH